MEAAEAPARLGEGPDAVAAVAEPDATPIRGTEVRRLSVEGLSSLEVPKSCRYPVRDILSCLWKLVTQDEVQKMQFFSGRNKIHPINDVKKFLPGAQQDLHVKAELLLFFVGQEALIERAANSMQQASIAKVNSLAKLPPERREVMLEEASGIASAVLEGFRGLRGQLEGDGRLRRLPGEELPALVDCLRGTSLAGPPDAKSRGVAQEDIAERWAMERWPGHRVLSSCCALKLDAITSAKGVKQEFDTLVVSEDGDVVAIVEAKAGSDLCSDLPKMLKARELLFQAGNELEFRLGMKGDEVVHVRVPAEIPHAAYVFGSGKPLGEIFAESMLQAQMGCALLQEFQRGTPKLSLDAQGKVKIIFSHEVVDTLQKYMDEFHGSLVDILQTGTVSLWVCDTDAPRAAESGAGPAASAGDGDRDSRE